MIKKIFKSLVLILLIFNFNISLADDHLSNKDLIKNLKQKISEFDVKPFKKKSLFQKNKEYIKILKSQLSDLKKEKEKKDKLRAATAELEREIIALGGRPLTEGQDPLEIDEVILSLRKQLEEIKAIKAEEKKAKEKAAAIALEKKQIKAAKKELIEEIKALGAKPVTETDPIDENNEIIALRKQLEEIKKIKDKLKADKEKGERIDEAKKELIKEIESLGAKPVTSTQDIDQDKEIIALKKQLDEIRAYKEDQKQKEIADVEKKKTEEEFQENRNELIDKVKNEIIKLGGTPALEFEVTNQDQYVEALKKQIDEIKALKEKEEKEIQQSIPEWFIMLPSGSEEVMYVRGTAISDDLQLSIDAATNAGLRELGKKMNTRLASKTKETVRQANIGEKVSSKTEMNRISTIVVKEVTVKGYEVVETKMVSLDNGNYRTFILLKYQIGLAYKNYIDQLKKSNVLKADFKKIENTQAFKELELYVSEFSGA
tara:strand:+ start:2231 stop:3691 length:1461 start_codon:yes stop_codon:yes gene_type:complete